jgi:hypothetical protein
LQAGLRRQKTRHQTHIADECDEDGSMAAQRPIVKMMMNDNYAVELITQIVVLCMIVRTLL